MEHHHFPIEPPSSHKEAAHITHSLLQAAFTSSRHAFATSFTINIETRSNLGTLSELPYHHHHHHHHAQRATMAEQSINIPQVIVFLVVSFLAVRWYFSKPTPESTRAAPNRSAARINPAQIEQVAQMFPQLDRRNIAWDLQRNGGNVAATTERALSGRGLDNVSHYARFRTLRKVKSR